MLRKDSFILLTFLMGVFDNGDGCSIFGVEIGGSLSQRWRNGDNFSVLIFSKGSFITRFASIEKLIESPVSARCSTSGATLRNNKL